MRKLDLNTQMSREANITQRASLINIKSMCPASSEMC
jgi:hypothetical protein